jgi:hypothetical protein
VDYPACDQKLHDLVMELWGRYEVPVKLTSRNYGLGTIYWGGASSDGLYPEYELPASILKEHGVIEDFVSTDSIRYGHRQTKEREIYFVSNKTNRAIQADCRFRVGKGQPELWDPVTGKTRRLPQYEQKDGATSISLQFVAFQSYFVVFPHSKSDKTTTAINSNFPDIKPFAILKGPWEVNFDTTWGGPKKVIFDGLQDWSKSKDIRIRHYSGIASYHNTFDLARPPGQGSKVVLALGKVHEMARVRLNEKDLGVVWCAPWQVDITDELREGENQLEIEVANLWPNRLIGDADLPHEKRFTWTAVEHPYKDEGQLMPSGLIGPVKLLTISYE